ncbi:MAG: acVLRF1 family peptidyl-tRNA hydrolase [Sporichthyaceae bacterium]
MTRTVDVDPERIGRWLENFGERNGHPVELGATASGAQVVADNGTVADLVVPFASQWSTPQGEDPRTGAARIALTLALRDHCLVPRTVGVLLARIGGFAAGVFVGAELMEGKAGSRHVQGRSAAGGWSQQRFARRREQQANQALEAAADYAARILLPALDDLDALVLGGERRAVDAVLADRRLAPLRKVSTEPRFLTVPDPKRDILLAAPDAFRAIRIAITDTRQP